MTGRIVLLAALGAALLSPSAHAGGWATTNLSSTPQNLRAGDTWTVDLTILQHGRTPLAGVEPSLVLTSKRTGDEHVFPARPTSETGVYRARVVFPQRGRWSYGVDDGFGGRYELGNTRIAAAAGAAGAVASPVRSPLPGPSDGIPWWPFALAAAAVAAGAGLTAAARRIRRSAIGIG